MNLIINQILVKMVKSLHTSRYLSVLRLKLLKLVNEFMNDDESDASYSLQDTKAPNLTAKQELQLKQR